MHILIVHAMVILLTLGPPRCKQPVLGLAWEEPSGLASSGVPLPAVPQWPGPEPGNLSLPETPLVSAGSLYA